MNAKLNPTDIPKCFYRVSIKALILNDAKDKFLIVQVENGKWELPGGGLDFGAIPQDDLPREIAEEMKLKVTNMAERPSYFITGTKSSRGFWNVNIVYEVELESLDFTTTDECVAIKFIGKDDADWLQSVDTYPNVPKLLEMFDPENH